MSRLTPKEREKYKWWKNRVSLSKALDKLANYEDLEEAGRTERRCGIMAMYNRLEWQRRTNEEKAESVCRALSLPTHNGYTKDDLIMMLDWCFHEMYECDKPCVAYQNRCECLRVLEGGGGDE